MSLFISSLNSGSNGNCYYVGNDKEGILVDAGISCKETETRMRNLGLQMNMVKAIFVSHEHSDHISGISILSKKFGLPVYITHATLKRSRLKIEPSRVKSFAAEEPCMIGELKITAFTKHHDADDPHSFIVEYNNVTVGIFTDIGRICERVKHYFPQCHACFFEANYDEEMLIKSSYPWVLKNRIKGGNGHLSNDQALEIFLKFRRPDMSYFILSHLSQNNNDIAKLQQLFAPYQHLANIVIASRYKESEVFEIKASMEQILPRRVVIKRKTSTSVVFVLRDDFCKKIKQILGKIFR